MPEPLPDPSHRRTRLASAELPPTTTTTAGGAATKEPEPTPSVDAAATTGHILAGGRTAGATRRGAHVVRRGGPWTPAVHAVLNHLEAAGMPGVPRVVGTDDAGYEVLTYLDGDTIRDTLPWPAWIRSDEAIIQVGQWLRRLHDSTASFVPPDDLTWFAGQRWKPGLIIGHHDAAPYNAVFTDHHLVGFVDWDTAGPSSRELDLAFTALTWVPLETHRHVELRGYTDPSDRAHRLHLLLDAYGYTGDRAIFGSTIARRARINADAIHRLANTGDPIYQAMLPAAAHLDEAANEIDHLPPEFWGAAERPVRR